jgi:hypothetical protein
MGEIEAKPLTTPFNGGRKEYNFPQRGRGYRASKR